MEIETDLDELLQLELVNKTKELTRGADETERTTPLLDLEFE